MVDNHIISLDSTPRNISGLDFDGDIPDELTNFYCFFLNENFYNNPQDDYDEIDNSSQKNNRNGQEKFRKDLIDIYGRCVVSGCYHLNELEAAHIVPVCENGEYTTDNGILLWSNLHKTFDNYEWSIEPESMKICTRENCGSIREYRGKVIDVLFEYGNIVKLRGNLKKHYDEFVKRLDTVG